MDEISKHRPRSKSSDRGSPRLVTQPLAKVPSIYKSLQSLALLYICLARGSRSRVIDNPIVRISNLVQSPSRTAVVVHSRPPQIPPVLAFKSPAVGPMKGTSIVPDDHVRGVLPLNTGGVLLLSDVVEQFLDQRIGLVFGKALDGMSMSCNVDVSTAARLVDLDQAVPSHDTAVRRVEVFEEFWGAELARLSDRVVDNIVFLQEFILQCGV
jgi:hypothetical protein